MKKEDQKSICMISGEKTHASDLIRFVLSPEKVLTPDLIGDLQGTSFYLAMNFEVISKLKNQSIIPSEFPKDTIIPKNLLPNLKNNIRRRLISLISLAKKAGKTIIGFNNLKKALEFEKIDLLIQAYNGSKREMERLKLPMPQRKRVQCLNSEELGLAFGRDTVIHAGIIKSGFTKNILLYNKKFEQLNDVAELIK